ncbi:MAG: methyltransferase domain-containing protein [Eggerthellaceae bacterium]|nr:methyltransferase domain-containing protein [Eggerthellaceae bacterium]
MMNIQEAKDQIKDTVEAHLERDDAGMCAINPARQRPMFLVGAPGIGKTAIIEQIAQELGIGVVSYSMTHHTRQSALGLPRIVHREFEGFEYDSSEYTMSEIVSSVYDYMEATGERRGILFLDEINCVSETLYPSMLQFLQFKTFGRHRVPEDWVIVCAGNPPEYNKSVHEFDVVTLDRLRQLDVEPDYAVWKAYAANRGLHPAVTTFLEAKPDCFYKVESKPGGGKSFVTARGWEDLAETIALYERMGKRCDRVLFAQFLRDEEIADRFSVYYSLFDKYRSDYQVWRILAGDADEVIEKRAQAAQFDERVALAGLILDALSTECGKALEQEAVVLELRDELRTVKPMLLEGGSVAETIEATLRTREAEVARKVAAGTAKPSWIRRENLAILKLRDLVAACGRANAVSGPEAFEAAIAAFQKEAERVRPLAETADAAMTNAFSFVGRCWGEAREMLVFIAELSTRPATTDFIAHFGNEAYYRRSEDLKVDEARTKLAEHVRELGADDGIADDYDVVTGEFEGNAVAAPLDQSGAVGLKRSTPSSSVGSSGVASSGIDAYYANREHEWGFASMSRMTLPGLSGMRVLDVCCRRGKGAYKLSARVGDTGHVIGVDWSADYIREADAGKERAWRDNHLKGNNMEFHVAYPEDLMAAGIGDNSVDVVYINNVTTLLYSISDALAEFSRVLKPGGLLICETVFSDVERDDEVVREARTIGNSIQAARTREEFYSLLADAGFAKPEVIDEFEVAPDTGFRFTRKVATVPTDEEVKFYAVALNVRASRTTSA